jgi:hypothetical protein
LVSTDPHASAAQLVERYASRWAIEITFSEAKHIASEYRADPQANPTPEQIQAIHWAWADAAA